MVPGPFRVLFLCTGNSARSQIAEALVNHFGEGRFRAESAGTDPAPLVNPGALEVLEQSGIPWHGLSPRGLEGLDRENWDLVVTVCDDARESCPIFPPGPIITHWSMPDPAAVGGDAAARRAAFSDAFALLRRRIGALLALPVEQLARPVLEARLREIGQTDAPVRGPEVP